MKKDKTPLKVKEEKIHKEIKCFFSKKSGHPRNDFITCYVHNFLPRNPGKVL